MAIKPDKIGQTCTQLQFNVAHTDCFILLFSIPYLSRHWIQKNIFKSSSDVCIKKTDNATIL